jgi:hypothetical protein
MTIFAAIYSSEHLKCEALRVIFNCLLKSEILISEDFFFISVPEYRVSK